MLHDTPPNIIRVMVPPGNINIDDMPLTHPREPVAFSGYLRELGSWGRIYLDDDQSVAYINFCGKRVSSEIPTTRFEGTQVVSTNKHWTETANASHVAPIGDAPYGYGALVKGHILTSWRPADPDEVWVLEPLYPRREANDFLIGFLVVDTEQDNIAIQHVKHYMPDDITIAESDAALMNQYFGSPEPNAKPRYRVMPLTNVAPF